MSFSAVTNITNILFKGWNTHSWKDVLIAAIVIGVMAIVFEGLKSLKSYLTLRRRQTFVTNYGEEDESQGSGIEVTSMHSELISSAGFRRVRRRQILLFTIESGLHMLNFFFGYILMFLVMTYNVWFLLAIIVGSGVGFFISSPIIDYFTSKYAPTKANTINHHHRGTHSHDGSFSVSSSGQQVKMVAMSHVL